MQRDQATCSDRVVLMDRELAEMKMRLWQMEDAFVIEQRKSDMREQVVKEVLEKRDQNFCTPPPAAVRQQTCSWSTSALPPCPDWLPRTLHMPPGPAHPRGAQARSLSADNEGGTALGFAAVPCIPSMVQSARCARASASNSGALASPGGACCRSHSGPPTARVGAKGLARAASAPPPLWRGVAPPGPATAPATPHSTTRVMRPAYAAPRQQAVRSPPHCSRLLRGAAHCSPKPCQLAPASLWSLPSSATASIVPPVVSVTPPRASASSPRLMARAPRLASTTPPPVGASPVPAARAANASPAMPQSARWGAHSGPDLLVKVGDLPPRRPSPRSLPIRREHWRLVRKSPFTGRA